MTTQQAAGTLTLTRFSKSWQDEVADQLISGEAVVATMELDLVKEYSSPLNRDCSRADRMRTKSKVGIIEPTWC